MLCQALMKRSELPTYAQQGAAPGTWWVWWRQWGCVRFKWQGKVS